MWNDVLCRKCGSMWNIELWWWDVECQCNTLSLHLALRHIIPPHFTLHHLTISTSHGHIPHSTSQHHSSPYRPFHIAPAPLAAHYSTNTIFKIAPLISPHYASRHISHCIPFYITFHITPHSMYSTPHLRSRHIVATTTSPITPHFTQHSCGTTFRILHHSTTSDRDHTQSTSLYHVSTFHITHKYTTIYIRPLSYHISRNTTSTTTLHNVPLTFHATALAPIHITPPLSITPFQFERLELCIWVILPKTRPAKEGAAFQMKQKLN